MKNTPTSVSTTDLGHPDTHEKHTEGPRKHHPDLARTALHRSARRIFIQSNDKNALASPSPPQPAFTCTCPDFHEFPCFRRDPEVTETPWEQPFVPTPGHLPSLDSKETAFSVARDSLQLSETSPTYNQAKRAVIKRKQNKVQLLWI